MSNTWHIAKTGNDQGLIIDESGANIAVTYDAKNAPLVSAAPALLDALEKILAAYTFGNHGNIVDGGYICLAAGSPELRAAEAAVASAK